MKSQKIRNKKYKLIRLNLLKSQIYSEQLHFEVVNNLLDKFLDQIELHLKQALKIIYEYHINNRKILFVGFPRLKKKKFFNIIRSTNHYFIPQFVWVNGVLSNRFSISRFLNKRILNEVSNTEQLPFLQKLKNLFKLKRKPDLIVLFNQNNKLDFIQESHRLGIPIISFGSNLYSNVEVTYKIPGNFEFFTTRINNTFNFLLYSIFKRPFKKFNKYSYRKRKISEYSYTRRVSKRRKRIQKRTS